MRKKRLWLTVDPKCADRIDELAGRLNLEPAELRRGLFESGLLRMLASIECNKDLDLQADGLIRSLQRHASYADPRHPMLR